MESSFFSFNGRINRLSYFLRVLLIIFGAFIIGFVLGFIYGLTGSSVSLVFLIPVGIVVSIAIFIACVSLVIRRLHDLNLSGIWYFVILGIGVTSSLLDQIFGELAPISSVVIFLNVISIIIFLVLLFWPGTRGPNNYGNDPKGNNSNYVDAVFGEGNNSRYYPRSASSDKNFKPPTRNSGLRIRNGR